MKKTFYLILFFSSVIFAQKAGENGLSFLKLSFGAKNAALADLAVVYSNDATALFYNPALLTNNKININITHNQSIQDLRSENFAFSFNYDDINFAVGVNNSSIDNIEIRNLPGEPIAKFNANYFLGTFSAAVNITDEIATGASVKYIYEGIYTDEATGYAVDLGLAYKQIIPNLNFGLSLRNIGNMNKLRYEKTKLPLDLRFGASYNFLVSELKSKIVLLGGINKYLNEEKLISAFATDIIYDEFFSLRIGYMTGVEARSISLGFGINYNNFVIDYAFVPYKYDLGNSNIITVGYYF